MSRVLPDLAVLLAQDEGQYLDRKSLWEGPPTARRARDRRSVRDEIAEYVAAFANAEGGVLVMGAEDDGTPTGHAYPPDVIEAFLAVPRNRFKPALPPGLRVQWLGHELLLFEVEPAPMAVMIEGNGFPVRVGDQVVRMTESQINALKGEGLVRGAETRPSGSSLADLDVELMARAAAAAGFRSEPVEEYLLRRRLADRRGGALVLREAAALLFATEPTSIANPSATVRVFRVRGTERKLGARHNVHELPRIEGNLATVIEATRTVLVQQIGTSAKLHALFFKEVPEYPTVAWQEALVNAVAHRDYRITGRGIEIFLYDDRLEIDSPGGLLPEVSLADLLTRKRVHLSRNPLIVRVLAELGLMREQGEGIPRMIEAMEESWLPLPELASDGPTFRVTLRNTPMLEAGDPSWAAAVRSLAIGIRQKRILVLAQDGMFTSAEYQKLNQVDRDTAYKEIRQLVQTGMVAVPEKRGRGARYRVLTGATSTPTDRIRQRMRENGRITNSDWRDVFGMNPAQASYALGKLCTQRVLVRSSPRGRGVVYVPGPAWAAWRGTSKNGE